MMPFDQVFEKLIGQWNVTKRISDGSSFKGQATISKRSQRSLLMDETGVLALDNGSQINGSRRWIWEFSCDSRLNIYFDENPKRLYHALEFLIDEEGWQAKDQHLCDQDTYEGRYQLTENSLQISHAISGPNKDYQITAEYVRK